MFDDRGYKYVSMWGRNLEDAMRFFSSRASENVYPTPYGTFFVTSERNGFYPRMYTVRFIAATEVQTVFTWHDGRQDTINHSRLDLVDTSADAFQRWASSSGAHTAAQLMRGKMMIVIAGVPIHKYQL